MKKKINVKLLRQVQQAIISEPKLYDQSFFTLPVDKNGVSAYEGEPYCGTACCIAGWAVKLSVDDGLFKRYVNGQYSIASKAKTLLGLTNQQAQQLFDDVAHDWDDIISISAWPAKYAKAYLNAKTPVGRARAGYNMIEDFIKQNA